MNSSCWNWPEWSGRTSLIGLLFQEGRDLPRRKGTIGRNLVEGSTGGSAPSEKIVSLITGVLSVVEETMGLRLARHGKPTGPLRRERAPNRVVNLPQILTMQVGDHKGGQ